MLKECMKQRQRVLGLRHPDTLSTINNIATLYLRSDKQDLAHDVYIDCTEECVEQLGRTHPISVTALDNLQELVALMRLQGGGSDTGDGENDASPMSGSAEMKERYEQSDYGDSNGNKNNNKKNKNNENNDNNNKNADQYGNEKLTIETSPDARPTNRKHLAGRKQQKQSRYDQASSGEDHGQFKRNS